MQATEGLVKLFNEWEIQLLVLLSFALQLFLFYAGSLRRRTSSGFLRFSTWMAYLGADFVAVYALGYLSRHDQDETREANPLAFFWAPFLLIHLGGQDTITAFSMEDNNLWLRHLLNLLVQGFLALYVFWKSIGKLHNAVLLVSGALVFVAGIIKYVERIWCLEAGSQRGLESRRRSMQEWRETMRNVTGMIFLDAAGYALTVLEALVTMRHVMGVLVSSGDVCAYSHLTGRVKVARLQLGLMYDELYTKALVLRTRSWLIFRHISQISFVAAFVLFHVTVDKRRYTKADVAITYSLFIGGFFIEASSVLNSMMSPWTWKMLKDHKWERLAKFSWFLFSSDIGWPEKKQRWPCSFGQYNFRSWLASNSSDRDQPRTFGQRVMAVVRRVMVDLVHVNKKKLFWMSKALDTWYMDADELIIDKYVAKEIILLAKELDGTPAREWPILGSLLEFIEAQLDSDFATAIVTMHVLTELHLRRYPPPSDMAAAAADDVAFSLAQVCRKLSNYMMYLLVVQPSMLPLPFSSLRVLEDFQSKENVEVEMQIAEDDLSPSKETVEEMVYMWTRLLLYAAGKSRAEIQAAHLTSTGGELITLVWLLMSFSELGDSRLWALRMIKTSDTDSAKEIYAFNITNQQAADISNIDEDEVVEEFFLGEENEL
uniref:Uncharacterized protein n=1 Tax=Avena sativa TaxID=4498 RepID=A0ACD6A8S0_AVESA